VQLLVLLTILAWATQTLMQQWARGQEIPVPLSQPTDAVAGSDGVPLRPDPTQPRPMATGWSDAQPDRVAPVANGPTQEQFAQSQEKFLAGSPGLVAGATLEVRSESSIIGGEVKLRQVCRWSEADKAAFEPIADLVLTRMAPNAPFRSVTLDEIKQTLHDAGMNLGVVRFAGSLSCTVSRTDVQYDAQNALQQWIDARNVPTTRDAAPPALVAALTPTTLASGGSGGAREAQPARFVPAPAPGDPPAKPAVDDGQPVHTLRNLLVADLAERLSVSADSLQVRFNPQDEKLLNLSEPQFRFNVDGRRARVLGDVVWEVTVVANGAAKKVNIIADAHAWQMQVLLNKSVAYKQIIRNEDLMDRRTLVDRLGDEAPATRETLVGQMAARDLKAGTILTTRLVDPVPLIQNGQLVSIVAEQGNVQIRTVARAMEVGTFGQTIRVRNEVTRDVYEVIVTGQQTGRMIGNTSGESGGNVAALEHN